MKFVYALISCSIVLLGVVHMLATLRLFHELSSSALWFFSGGIAMALAGALNLLNRVYGQNAPGLRRVCIGTNITMTAFAIVSGVVSRASAAELVLVIGLMSGATVLSLSKSARIQHPALQTTTGKGEDM